MSFFRLFQSSLMIALTIAGVSANLAAQSSPEKTAPANAPLNGQLNIRDGTHPNWLSVLGDQKPPVLTLKEIEELSFTHDCLMMRMYKVRRDDPNSDSTQLVGYSTCLPTARIQTYTVDQRGRLILP